MTITTEANLATQAKLALNIACKNKKALVLLLGSGPIAFNCITKVQESSIGANIVQVRGRVLGPHIGVLPKELDHWVTIDLNRVDAIIDRDLGCLEDDILSEFD